MKYLLSLDMGVQSIGWGIISQEAGSIGKPIRLGVRCFESGTGTADDISKGKDESRNVVRQSARALRKTYRRRTKRTIELARILQKYGLLPSCDSQGVCYRVARPLERDRMIKELDCDLASEYLVPEDRAQAHLLPYVLRTEALYGRLLPFALGRALYHLGQRRGFLSNRKTAAKEGEDEGKVKGGISQLQKDIDEKGCRTLGEFFRSLDPEENRIRQRYTSRQMYQDEFDAIWSEQAKRNPDLTDKMRSEIHHALFFQRPLKSQRGKLGKCELVKGKRRAPKACLEFQRFRYWQKILDLKNSLTCEQLNCLANALENCSSLSYREIKKLLGFKANVNFNLAEGGSKGIEGNRTSARLAEALPDRWPKMTEPQKRQMVDEMLQFEREDALAKRLIKVFGLSATEAEAAACVPLEPGYASLSKQAIAKLLPYMRENQIQLNAAIKDLFNVQRKTSEVYDLLPPLKDVLGQIRNPVVERALAEMRKVVNAIIRQYGKPELIRVELARDMKKSRKQREADTRKNRENEAKREAAIKKIIAEMGIANPTRADVLKVLLAEECNWRCPYTGKSITMKTLLGSTPEFDIEHTLPFSKSLDNSYSNKTLCEIYENRHVKRNRSPWEAYHGDEKKYQEILDRVRRFKGGTSHSRLPGAKLRRFMLEEISQDFASRMLNDTRYISRLACDYLGLLWGGQIDRSVDSPLEGIEAVGFRRISVCNGQATSWLRREWGLNSILNDGGDEKTRLDHRHHAVDAAAIAFCDPSLVSQLAQAAQKSEELNVHRLFLKDELPLPYETFLDDVRASVDQIHVSYRCNRRISGGFHNETNYSKPHLAIHPKTGKPTEYRYLRKPLGSMTINEINEIVDPSIKQRVLDKLEQFGSDIKMEKRIKMFEDPSNLPYRRITSADGSERLVFVKKARFRQIVSTQTIGSGANERYVATANNHHMEVYAELDKDGNEKKWLAVTVPLIEAYARLQNHQPVINRDHGPNTRFKFSLAKNEFLLNTDSDGKQTLKRVYKISGSRIGWGDHTDARPAVMVTKTSGNTPFINSLRGHVQKVSVDLLGDIHPASD